MTWRQTAMLLACVLVVLGPVAYCGYLLSENKQTPITVEVRAPELERRMVQMEAQMADILEAQRLISEKTLEDIRKHEQMRAAIHALDWRLERLEPRGKVVGE